jgi:hypothetical protein
MLFGLQSAELEENMTVNDHFHKKLERYKRRTLRHAGVRLEKREKSRKTSIRTSSNQINT